MSYIYSTNFDNNNSNSFMFNIYSKYNLYSSSLALLFFASIQVQLLYSFCLIFFYFLEFEHLLGCIFIDIESNPIFVKFLQKIFISICQARCIYGIHHHINLFFSLLLNPLSLSLFLQLFFSLFFLLVIFIFIFVFIFFLLIPSHFISFIIFRLALSYII